MGPAASWDDFAAACAALAGQEAPRLDPQRPVWIFGAGGFGRDLGRVLQAQGFALAGFIDSKPRQDSLLGLPVRSWQQLEARDFSAQLAIGIFNRDTPFDGLEAAAKRRDASSRKRPASATSSCHRSCTRNSPRSWAGVTG